MSGMAAGGDDEFPRIKNPTYPLQLLETSLTPVVAFDKRADEATRS